MGCDIHMFVEYKVDGGAWQAHEGHTEHIEYEGEEDEYSYVNTVMATGRNYDLFARIASVRGQYDDSLEPRGIPDDVSPLIKKASDMYGIDGHSHSYVSLEELEDVLKKFDYYEPTDRTEMFYDWQDYRDDFKNRPPDYTTIVAACKAQAKELSQVDKILLDSKEGSVVKHRIVFFFDN